MKKIWIIVGIVALLVFVLAGAWWYLLMNGRPENLSGIPNPFGSFGSSNEFAPPENTNSTEGELPQESTALRKISATPIAGSVIFQNNDSTLVRYVERGTGHIYEVDVATDKSIRITNTTIPRTTEAIWSPQGNRVIIVSEETSNSRRIFINTLERNDIGEILITSIELPNSARDMSFASTGESVYYTTPTMAGSTGYEHNLKTSTRTELFNSVLRDIVVTWEPEILIYTTPSAQTAGYAYTGASFTRITGGVGGLMLTPTRDAFTLTFIQNGTLSSYGPTPTSSPLGITIFPDKCTADSTKSEILWCGAPPSLASGQYPDLWYQGVASFDDMIWKVDVYNGGASLISIPSEDVGEVIDVLDMHVNNAGTMLIFTNKRDGHLWLQEVTS